LRWSELRIFEDSQSVASSRQLEEPLIFSRKIQQNVTSVDAKHKEEKENALCHDSHGQEYRQKTESAKARTEQDKDTTGPIEQEQLEPGLLNFVEDQDAQRFRGAYQKADRTGFVSNDELTMRHRLIQ
jgi:hypothetical protein